MFFRQHKEHITLLVVYVDDIMITGNDEGKFAQLKVQLSKEFTVKDLSLLRYFLRIEVAHGAEAVLLSRRKYVLDLLTETGMLACRLVASPIDPKIKLFELHEREFIMKGIKDW